MDDVALYLRKMEPGLGISSHCGLLQSRGSSQMTSVAKRMLASRVDDDVARRTWPEVAALLEGSL